MHERRRTLKAPDEARLFIWFEPWAEGLGFPPGCIVELWGTSEIEGDFELDVTEERTAVYGWAGSTLQVVVDGTMVHSFDQPVPDTESALSTKDVITMLFGPAPAPDAEEKKR